MVRSNLLTCALALGFCASTLAQTAETRRQPREIEQAQELEAIREHVQPLLQRIELERRLQAVQEIRSARLPGYNSSEPLGERVEPAPLSTYPLREGLAQEILGSPINYQIFSRSLAGLDQSGPHSPENHIPAFHLVNIETMLNGIYARAKTDNVEAQEAHNRLFIQSLVHMIRQGLPFDYAVHVSATIAQNSLQSAGQVQTKERQIR